MFFKSLKLFIFIMLSFVFGRSVWAVGASVEAQVDQQTLSVDDTLTLTVIIRGGNSASSPDIPPLGHFDVVGQSSAQQIEVINGDFNSVKTFQYVLAPRSAGDFSIGPIKVYIEGQVYSAGTIRIKVTPSNHSPTYTPQAPQFPFQTTPPNLPTAPSKPEPSAEARDVFITTELDKKESYLGEQVIFTFRLYAAVNVQASQFSLPEFKDFISEILVKDRNFQTELNGQRYMVNEWRLALFPTKAGDLTIGKTEIKADVTVPMDRFFNNPFGQGLRAQTRTKTLTAPPLNLKVKDLPPAPANFTGLVGQFTLSSTLSQDQLKLGETSNLKIELSGKGNLQQASLPRLENLGAFKVYPDQPTLKLEKTAQGIQGKKIFNEALVAEKPGTVKIPPISLSYFDPNTTRFVTLSTPEMTVTIQGSPNAENLVTAGLQKSSPNVASETVIKAGEDLRAIRESEELLQENILSRVNPYWAWGVFAGAPLFFFALFFMKIRQRRAEAFSEDRKRSRAFKEAKKNLLNLKTQNSEDNFLQINAIIKQYLGNRFQVNGAALTPNEIEVLLSAQHMRIDLIRRLSYLLEELESWKYGGISQLNLPQEKELKLEILDILREIEKAL